MRTERIDEVKRQVRATVEYRRRHRARRRLDRRQPELLAGLDSYTTGPPDYVGVGAHRSGTTWWNGLIRQHPGVWRPREFAKECHYFNGFWRRPFGDDDVRSYHALFPRPDGAITGEWTPRYISDYWTPALLHRAAPDAKLLVILRDPVARYRSGLAQELALHPNSRLVTQDQFARGFYHRQLTHLLRQFPRGRILVLQLEACWARREQELRRTYAFLGLDPGFLPTTLHGPGRPRRAPAALPPHVEEALGLAYRDDVLALVEAFPEIDPSLWPTAVGALSAGG